ncbi:DUF4268 domain-containing protein [Burkholderia sp. MBR-1]|uniref:DUF4268 domain-containing protein n=1 Tax=Burkholderia sp. MBR-1 TaxID=2732364 RepID=UPI0015EF7A3F|nr:DUF4268 domain-containing protein [Burkholderia sp. MBR-1]QMI49927.1 DUF4268 domain-containing protein [Burkholderia sp. MBR-1]
MEFGKIVNVPLRNVWNGEATDFTPWLAENLKVLDAALGMDLVLQSREVSAGDFSADIVALDISTNRRIVIENQFGATDHRHLGQIITYASALNANAVVWLAERIRAEHKAAIDFLNVNLKESLQLFAIEASLIKIDDSRPALNFSIVCAPTESPIADAPDSGEVSDLKRRYQTFFQGLLDELREKHSFTNARMGQPQNWYSFSSENSRVYKYSVNFTNDNRVKAEIYIDTQDKAQNEAIFDLLLQQKDEIERQFGERLEWERLDTRRGCRIAVYRDGSIDAETAELISISHWLVAKLLKLREVFPKFLSVAVRSTKPAI